MELSDVAKWEIETHMDIELGRNRLTPVAQKELETHMDIELGRNRLSNVAKWEIETHMDIELNRRYKPSKPLSLWPYNTNMIPEFCPSNCY